MDPLLEKRWKRFKRNRRGYYCLWILTFLFGLSLFSEWFCNNIPYAIRFEEHWYFPILKHYPAELFGDEVSVTPDYKEVLRTERFREGNNWALFPPIPYGANESSDDLESPPPSKPTRRNWLGTDDRGRDLATRLLYGFRNSMLFALVSWAFISLIAYCFGALQGYVGGRVDFVGQRLTEIWNSLPILYVVIFLLSVFRSQLWLLTLIWVVFGWIGLASYVRAEVLRVRKLDYITAGRALGASTQRILWRHVLPNTLTPLITFSPFVISASVGSLAALDYLGLGLPPPTASWGELMRQGKENLNSWWLAFFPFASLFVTMLLLNFIGEAVRNAFDSRE